MDLFVCWANVGRSQVAEWFARKFWKKIISCASVEARKEMYSFKPEKVITEILFKKYNIDISKQEVFYPSDIINNIEKVDNIYFLFDPKKAKKSDEETLINWKTLWEYLDSVWKNYNIYEIEDPDEKDEKVVEDIVYQLYDLVNKIYK